MNSQMEEQEALQQEMKLKHKQDSKADMLAQPQTFSGYSEPVVAAIQKPMPFDGSILWDTYKLQSEAVAMMNHWGEHDKAAFTKLKTALIEAPVLAYPDPSYPFLLDTDASNVGFGAVLSQMVEGRERPCSGIF